MNAANPTLLPPLSKFTSSLEVSWIPSMLEKKLLKVQNTLNQYFLQPPAVMPFINTFLMTFKAPDLREALRCPSLPLAANH
jgi:hypothetical protein